MFETSAPPKFSTRSLLQELLLRKQAQTSLTQFIEYRGAGFSPAAHHRLLIEHLEAVERGDIERLMVCMPPGSSKSTYTSVEFPAWFLGRNPNKSIIAASHTQELAERFGRRVRNIAASAEFANVFNVGLADDSQAAGRWDTNRGGEYFAAGVGGSITGRRADCLVAHTVVQTDIGPIQIGSLKLTTPRQVLTWADGRPTYRRILAVAQRNAEEIWRITTAAGRVVEATGHHRFLTAWGWSEASDLVVGDELLCAVRLPDAEVVPWVCGPVGAAFEAASDFVIQIERIGQSVPVYDIQVAETECFFANGVLVHNCAIIDDPVKSREDADSERARQRAWDWYTNDLLTRLKPRAAQIVVLTRWHEDDLGGRILERERDKWTLIELAMEARPGDPLGRKPGERLWPEWFTAEMVETAKLDVRAWNALYQQQPASEDGEYFKRDWFGEYDTLPTGLRHYGASDYAVTDGGGDYTEHGIFAVDASKNLYVVDWWRAQTTSDVWIEKKCDLIAQYEPMCWFGEAGPIRKAIEPFMVSRMSQRNTHCRIEWLASVSDKPTRARSFQAMASMGKVLFPKHASWKAEVIGQLLRFPAGRNDDVVDVCSLIGRGLEYINANKARTPKQLITQPGIGFVG